MDRKDFLKSCGMACMGFGAATLIVQGCSIPHSLTGKIDQSDLIILLTEFEMMAGKQVHYKKYIVISKDELKFPICIFRHTSAIYTAL